MPSNKRASGTKSIDDTSFRTVCLLSTVLALLGALCLVALLLYWWSSPMVLPAQAPLAAQATATEPELGSSFSLAAMPPLALWLILAAMLGGGAVLAFRTIKRYRFGADFARTANHVADFNQARLMDFIELSSDWMWETDQEHRFSLVSGGIRSIANMDVDVFVGKTPWTLPGDETSDENWNELRHKLAQREAFTLLLTRRDLANVTRHLEFTGKPLFDSSGFVGYRGVGRDLTQQIEAERHVRTSEERFRTLIETFFDWYWEQDEQLRYTRLLTSPHNPVTLAEADFLGHTRWEVVSADTSQPEWAAHIEQLRRHEPFDNFVYRRTRKDGRSLWFSVTGRPSFDTSGRFSGYRGVTRDVTREQETRQALIDSEARYRTTFERAPVGITNISANGRLESVNLAFSRLVGIPPESLIGKHFSELTHPQDQASDEAMFNALCEGRIDSFTREKRYVHADGHTVWGSVSVTALRHDDNRLRACIAVVQDVTARVTAERERLNVEERYRRLVDVSPDGIIVHRNQRIVFANRAAVAIFGTGRTETLLGQSLDAFYTQASPASEGAPHNAPPGTIMPREQQPIQRANGSTGDVEITSVVIGFDDGPAVLSVVRDISERIAAENALQQSRARYQEVVESVNEVIFQTGTDGRFVFLNQAWETTTGYRPQESTGRMLTDFLHPDDRPLARAHFDAVLAGNERDCVCEVRLRNTEGELRWLETHARPMRDPHGVVIGAMGSLDDITARKVAELTLKNVNKELEARVRARTAELEASNRELEAFSYSVSHDLRAPLRAIDGYSVIIQEDMAARLDETSRTHLERIRTATARMAQLIDDLIELARLTRQPLRRQNIDLSRMVADIVKELAHTDPSRRLDTDITPGLTANADPTLMRVALENLLRNAWKFSAGRDTTRIAFFATRDDEGISFCIEDNGVGFDMSYAGKLFVPFYRLHSGAEFQGSGIGLATVARIIQRHGGTISAESAPDEGARFRFSIGH